MQQRRIKYSLVFVMAIAAAVFLQSGPQLQARSAVQTVQAPMFEVDPLWPKPLPEYWLLGSVVGVAIDSRDHVYVLNLTNSFTARTEIGATVVPPIADCCRPSPDVLEFDSAGRMVASWGGPSTAYQWPVAPSGIGVDPTGNVWIGGSGPSDTHILKFSREGRFVRRFGEMDSAAVAAAVAAAAARAAAAAAETTYRGMSVADRAAANARGGGGARGAGGGGGGGQRGGGGGALPPNSASTTRFGGASRFGFDAQAREVFVADGARNRRVAVVDMESGAVKRVWGAYGKPPVDSAVPAYDPAAPAAQHFRTPVACAAPTTDGFVYVCDRASNRIQVFQKNGTFVKEKVIMPATRSDGAVWDIAFSRDPQQRFMYVADGRNMKVHVLDRQSLEVLTSFGEGGRIPGAFLAVQSIAVDSRGNIYTGEASEGKRVQKFVYRGIGAVPRNQGILWPRR